MHRRPLAKSNDKAIRCTRGRLSVGHTTKYRQKDAEMKKALMVAGKLPQYGDSLVMMVVALANDGFIRDSHNSPKYYCDLFEQLGCYNNDSQVTCWAFKKKQIAGIPDLESTTIYMMPYSAEKTKSAIIALLTDSN